MKLEEHVPLAPLTTLGVGGEARFFVEAHTLQEVTDALDYARTHALPVFVLGGGSNIVIADSGFEGLVLHVCIAGITCEEREKGRVNVTAGAGVLWDDLVAYTVAHGFIGLECLSGIPGTVGGAVVANLGAYGAQCSDTFVSAEVLARDDETHTARVFTNGMCEFSYHDSMFGHMPGRYLVLEATFSLLTTGTSHLSYRDNRFDLAALAAKHGREPTPADVRAAILEMRAEKGVLASSYKSAGSFFHMPFVSSEMYAKTVAKAQILDSTKEERLRPWAWEQPDGAYKIAPGFLLEYTEFQKGYVRGAAGISPKHTLCIINIAGARASEIALLARAMQQAVENVFGIHLEREVEYVGAVEKEN
ncbi:UDP-N-acetylenolpyruvoylglucosamine reductase [Candidatus Kaiserbacteria bacterium GWA2_50_9]|uniref:UDP-N-acetylenolpyruvoylglucosamine reductase n=1 Tax=Candidatus Kaiserbacteria bacterium GWA2_50_9 TaxID=1798474 RepID=A0A1F6BSF1_9BACT|nr:MAG: UDP-N-acetylenolpyruvoylglucosamine reductase [Candidatus Kaiserbacteria bacterium GWA2_50_9]